MLASIVLIQSEISRAAVHFNFAFYELARFVHYYFISRIDDFTKILVIYLTFSIQRTWAILGDFVYVKVRVFGRFEALNLTLS